MSGESASMQGEYRQRSLASFDAVLDRILSGEISYDQAQAIMVQATEEPELAVEVLSPLLPTDAQHPTSV